MLNWRKLDTSFEYAGRWNEIWKKKLEPESVTFVFMFAFHFFSALLAYIYILYENNIFFF